MRRSLILLGAVLVAAAAGEAGPQPIFLPHAELLQRLDAGREWQLVPYADYRRMRAAVRAAAERLDADRRPARAWIAAGTVRGRLSDKRLTARATLAVVAEGPGPARARLFERVPPRLGSVRLDGRLAVCARAGTPAGKRRRGRDATGRALDVLLPGPGRYELTCTWEEEPFAVAEPALWTGAWHLPTAAGLDARLAAEAPGEFAGPGLVRAAGDEPIYRCIGSAARIPLRWFPGRRSGAQRAVVGAAQTVTISADAAGALRFSLLVDLDLRHGDFPTDAELELPPGWVAHALPAELRPLAEGRFRIVGNPTRLELAGVLRPDASVDLPSVSRMAWRGGRIHLQAGPDWHWRVPPSWWVIGPDSYAVGAPGDPLELRRRTGPPHLRVRGASTLAIAEDRIRLDQILELSVRGALFRLPLRLPPGWRLVEARATGERPVPVHVDRDADGGSVLRFPTGLGHAASSAVLALSYRPATEGDRGVLDSFVPPGAAGVLHQSHDLTVTGTADLRLDVAAGDPWRALPFPRGTGTGRRALLHVVGDPDPVAIVVRPRRPACEADAVTWFLPAPPDRLAEEGWVRCDLRLTVRDGQAETFLLDLPFADPETVRYDHRILRLEREGDRWRLAFLQAWNGVRTLRLEGPPAAALATGLPRVGLTLPDGGTVGLRQWLALQIDDTYDPKLELASGLQAIDSDELPNWARAVPGLPVSRSWRLPRDTAPGSIVLATPRLAAVPDGFVDAVRVATQLDRDGSLNLLGCVVAAPGLPALALGLPAGAELVDARVDGRVTAVRREGGSLLLPLPGRTQCEVLLRYRIDRGASADAWDLRLPLPRLSGLPVIRTEWRVGVPADWLVEPGTAPSAIPLERRAGRSPRRAWLGCWRPARPAAEDLELPPPARPAAADPRRLSVNAPPDDGATGAGDRRLALQGVIYVGTCTGPARLEAELVQADRARLMDRLALALALLLAFGAVCLLRRRAVLALVLGSLLGTWALYGSSWGMTATLCQAFTPAVLVAAAALWFFRRRWRAGPGAALFVLGCAAMLGAGEGEPRPSVLGSYTGLDGAGNPRNVRIALTREQLERLRELARRRPEPPAPPAPFAAGAPSVVLALDGETLRGRLSLPIVVFADEWQEIDLPAGGARLGRIRFLDREGRPQRLAPVPTDGGVRLPVPPATQGVLVVDLALATSDHLPLPGGPGGSLRVDLPAGNELWVDGRKAREEAGTWLADLPARGDAVPLAVKPTPAAAREQLADLHLRFAQRVRVALHPDRLEWQAELAVTARRSSFAELSLDLPPELLVHAVRGQGLASWQQLGEELRLQMTGKLDELRLGLAGVVPLVGEEVRVLLSPPPGCERIDGRLGLLASDWGSLRCAGEDLRRVNPARGERLAYRVAGRSEDLRVAWRLAERDLHCRQYGALYLDRDHVRARLLVTLRGKGKRDRLRLRLAAPWEPVPDQAGVRLVEDGAARHLVVQDPTGDLGEGADLAVELRARVIDLRGAEGFVAPDCSPLDGTPPLERQEWLIGDGRTLRVEAVASTDVDPASFRVLKRRFADLRLPAGVRWRQAVIRRDDEALGLRCRTLDARVALDASHYLVMVEGRLRWSSRLTLHPRQGRIDGFTLRLPAGCELQSLQAPNLGEYRVDGAVVAVSTAAPTDEPLMVTMELTREVTDQCELHPYAVDTGEAVLAEERHTLAVVPDEVGLTHLEAQGLEPCEADRRFIAALPTGVDHRLVRNRWRGRGDWSLSLKHEEVQALGGADQLVTLVDGTVVMRPDGSLRGRATWHVVNRSLRQLELVAAEGMEIWQARVDGRPARFRRRAAGGLVLPMPTLRPGQASIPIEIVWSQAAAGDLVRVQLPSFADLRVMNGLLQVVPPAGYAVEREGGTMHEVPPATAMEERSQRVIDELARLRKQGDDLTAAGLERLNDNLALLEQELADYTGQMKRLADVAGHRIRRAQYETNVANMQLSQEGQERVQAILHGRRGRDRALGREAIRRDWRAPANVAAVTERGLPSPPAWIRGGVRTSAERLGPGEAPPGLTARRTVRLHGIDLLGDPRGEALTFRGQTGHLAVTLELEREESVWWRWLLGGVALLIVAVAAWRWHRPASWIPDADRLFR